MSHETKAGHSNQLHVSYMVCRHACSVLLLHGTMAVCDLKKWQLVVEIYIKKQQVYRDLSRNGGWAQCKMQTDGSLPQICEIGIQAIMRSNTVLVYTCV